MFPTPQPPMPDIEAIDKWLDDDEQYLSSIYATIFQDIVAEQDAQKLLLGNIVTKIVQNIDTLLRLGESRIGRIADKLVQKIDAELIDNSTLIDALRTKVPTGNLLICTKGKDGTETCVEVVDDPPVNLRPPEDWRPGNGMPPPPPPNGDPPSQGCSEISPQELVNIRTTASGATVGTAPDGKCCDLISLKEVPCNGNSGGGGGGGGGGTGGGGGGGGDCDPSDPDCKTGSQVCCPKNQWQHDGVIRFCSPSSYFIDDVVFVANVGYEAEFRANFNITRECGASNFASLASEMIGIGLFDNRDDYREGRPVSALFSLKGSTYNHNTDYGDVIGPE